MKSIILQFIRFLLIPIRKLLKIYHTSIVIFSIKEYKKPLYVGGKTRLTGNTILGSNTNFNGLRIFGKGNVIIGDNFHSGVDCLIITDVHDYDNGEAIPYGSNMIVKDVIIEDNVWIGSRVTILGGVKIGEGSIIQAGAVVVNNIPKYSIVGGCPAKPFKYRDIEHYKFLKDQGKFH